MSDNKETKQAPAGTLNRDAIQQKALDCGLQYWRASDAHGVIATSAQAVDLLQDLLGVEVEIKEQAPAVEAGARDERAAFEAWLPSIDSRPNFSRHVVDGYDDWDVERAWAGWQARAALARASEAAAEGALIERLKLMLSGDAAFCKTSVARAALEQAIVALSREPAAAAEPIYQVHFSHGWMDVDAMDYDGLSGDKRIVYAAPQPATVPAGCDVRKILLRVVPGDGNGHEVYAKNVADVEALLSELGRRVEDFEASATAPTMSEAECGETEQSIAADSYHRIAERVGTKAGYSVQEHIDAMCEVLDECSEFFHDFVDADEGGDDEAVRIAAKLRALKNGELERIDRAAAKEKS